jgi:hypothetical protein
MYFLKKKKILLFVCFVSVFYAARSTKKHKSFDEGILSISGRTCTLKNMQDIIIVKRLHPKSTDQIKIGDYIEVGNYEMEINSIIEKQNYLSGQCFASTVQMKNTETEGKQKHEATSIIYQSTQLILQMRVS